MGKSLACTFCLCLLVVIGCLAGSAAAGDLDSWEVFVKNSGVSAMHVALTHDNQVIIFDRTDFGRSQIVYPDGYCRHDPNDLALKVDCTAHSVEVDLATSAVRTLRIQTDTWCSSGAFQSDGTLLQTGGWNDGGNVVRTIGPTGADDWIEYPGALHSNRWYATDHILPDNTVIIIGGRRQFSYEFQPHGAQFNLPFLQQTDQPGSENNLYPFVFLNVDGNLFIFANKDSILFNYKTSTIVRTYPALPGGARNYPSSGSAVLLPVQAPYRQAEVLVCGGAPSTSFQDTGNGIYQVAEQTCGRLVITEAAPKWAISQMPIPRVMGDMLILPTGEVLIINGASSGTAGYGAARDPVLTPVLYNPPNNRFTVFRPTTIPRMYHSTAIILPDGKVFVGGSNTNAGYTFVGVPYPTELRLEKYSPYYLSSGFNLRRPTITTAPAEITYGANFAVWFTTAQEPVNVQFRLYAPSFTTHTFSQNQRQLLLAAGPLINHAGNYHSATVTGPPSTIIAPAGWYLLFVVNQGTPSATAAWVHVG